MSTNCSHVHGALSSILILSLASVQACSLATPSNSSQPVSSASSRKYDLTGVWIGTSITGCTPLRMNGPWRCGARADMMLTFIGEDRSGMIGIYASDRGQSGDAFQEKGSILEVPERDSGPLWLRVIIRSHSSCLFSGSLRRNEMGGSYICFRDGTSFERGRWTVRRSY